MQNSRKQVKLAFGEKFLWKKLYIPREPNEKQKKPKKPQKNQPTLKPKLAESAVIYDIPYESNYRTSFKNFIKTVNLHWNVLGTICWQKPTLCRLTYGRTSLSRAWSKAHWRQWKYSHWRQWPLDQKAPKAQHGKTSSKEQQTALINRCCCMKVFNNSLMGHDELLWTLILYCMYLIIFLLKLLMEFHLTGEFGRTSAANDG